MKCTHGDVIRENNVLRRRNERLSEVNRKLTARNAQLERQAQTAATMAEHWRIHSSTQNGGES